MTTPTAELHEGFSEPGATAVPWAEVERVLLTSEMFFLATVRADRYRFRSAEDLA